VNPGWIADVALEVDAGSGEWTTVETVPLRNTTVDHDRMSFHYSGDSDGDGPVRTRLKLVDCRLPPDIPEALGVNPLDMTISSTPVQ